MTVDDDRLEDRLLHRLLFFTDAVFAIVMTLLVLELKPPEGAAEANAETLREAAPHIGAFAFSVIIIGIFWLAHMNTMRRLARFDWPTAMANIVFLLPVCLVPYATAWIGADLEGGFSWAVYCSVLVAVSAANMALVLVAYRGGGRNIAGGAQPGERRFRMMRAASPGLGFLVGLLILAAGFPIVAHYCWLLIPPIAWFTDRFLRPKVA